MQAEERAVTETERVTLARWGSWGASGVAEVFDESRTEYEVERAELRELLDEAEYTAARRTVINAHYTDPAIATEVWGALSGLGFQGGAVLEPGSGVGTFIGLAPEGTQMTGVELDPVTAAISQAIYPEATIRTESFADTRMPSGVFDAAVGNVPFSRNSLHDARHNAGGHSMHNHFILKSLALTRPGGVVGVLSSAFTLDAQNPAARREMAATADLLGAVRLPTGAHRRAAGTDALTDVLIFRRRLAGEEPLDQSWVDTAPVELDGQRGRMNAYFLENPQRVLGQPTIGNGMYGSATLTVRAEDLTVTGDRLHEQLAEITGQAVAAGRGMAERTGKQELEAAALIPAGEQEQIGHITDRGAEGFTQVTVDGMHAPLKVARTRHSELRALLGLRDAARAVLSLEAANVEDTPELDAMREQLRDSYLDYYDRYGPINRFTERRTGKYDEAGADILARVTPPAVALLGDDPFGPLVLALEHFDEGTRTAAPAGLLSQRQVQPRRPVLGVDTPDEALAVTLDTLGAVELANIAGLLGTDEASARESLGELVYEMPGEPGVYETRAEYLSGDVREKLDTARAASAAEARFQTNVAALEAVLPAPLGADEIEARIGAVWVAPEIHEQFLRHIIKDPAARVDRISGATWDVKASRHVFAARNDWGTERMAAGDIFKNLTEQRRIQVTDPDPTDPEGNRRVVNATETTAAQEKAALMQERFSEWVWEDPARAAGLVDEYNRRFNSIVLRDYTAEGERLSFPGLVKNFTPRPHQRAAVARMLSEPSVGLFHEVGAGKTAEMVMGAMELRRLGMARKPVVVVPNHMLEQFTREWLQLYPQAQILAASSADLKGEKRRTFVARAAASDWDGIIMTRTAFERIELSEESKNAYNLSEVGRQRAELEAANERATASGADTMSIKRMEARLQATEEKLKKKMDRSTDPGITFEQTGIDYLVVDELHDFKNLSTPSNIQDAAIDPGSGRATDLHMKVEYLRSQHGDRVMTGATATPIANSVTEMYVMQRYLGPELLERAGIHDFDTWAATFGQVVTEMELSVAGGDHFKLKERFAKFQNVPELLKMFHTFADVKTAEDLKLPTPDLVEREDGKRLPRMVPVEASAELEAYIEEIGRRAEAIQARLVDRTEDNMLKVSSDGRKAALDMRLVDPELGSIVSETKVSVTADLIAQVHEEHRDDVFLDPASGEEHPTRGGLQIVFCDQSTPSTEKWNVYDELKDQLVQRGIPAEKIRFMHEAKNDAEKGRLFSAARAGDIAVLIGSTQRMGVGTNIQARAVHLVDLDAPWRPADIAQRHGRIIRQGNQNLEVAISQVVTKGSFDTFMWQTLERKSKFIDQIMRGRLDVREIEDVGDNTLSFAEVKAISSGNPLILEKSKADQELARLERLNRAWHRNQSSLVFRKDAAQARADALEQEIPAIRAAAERTTDELGGAKFRMTINGATYDKRTEAAEAWQRWAGAHATSRPPRAGETDLGVVGAIGGHDIRVVQRPGNLADLSASPVELRIDDAPGVAVEVTRATSLNPSVGMIQRLENQVRALPEEVTKREAGLESARQEAVDAREALGVPFKHQDALEAARWEVERIGRAMRGEETPQPTLDPELEALKKRMRINFPDAPTAGRSSGGHGGNGPGRPLEVARRHDEQRPQQGGLEL
ncbi:helicase-related protein [Kocuria rosea]|uniref:helicase-related protein n=1 Tax=Kocuria rosea TaxID=1275 RepID=UPI0025B763D2|nr:helicase-related protein [Kocuria rosea]WJZ68487.1 helicase-related protein [Kocuria rosea]